MPDQPIKVRGKGNAKQQRTKHQAEGDEDQTAVLKRRKITKNTKNEKVTLLDLPLEIKGAILLLSDNINLILTCRRLVCLRNDHHILARMVIGAFSPTWERFRGSCPEREYRLYRSGHRYSPDIDNENEHHLQTRILKRRCYFTIDVILKAQKIWYHALSAERKREFRHWRETSFEGDFKCSTQCSHCEEAVLDHCFDPIECFEHDYQLAKRGTEAGYDSWARYRRCQEIESSVVFPASLLRNWRQASEADEKLAFWLFTGGAHVRYFEEFMYSTDKEEIRAIMKSYKKALSPFWAFNAGSFFNLRRAYHPKESYRQFLLWRRKDADGVEERACNHISKLFGQACSRIEDLAYGPDERANAAEFWHWSKEFGLDDDSDIEREAANYTPPGPGSWLTAP